MGFAKLDDGIVNSTLWVQPHDVLRVWIWFLSQADSRGIVRTAPPALALVCMVPLERMREILALLESPDPDSRSQNDDGRRIEKIDGGWRIINYGKYRESRDPEQRRQYQRKWDQDNRPSGHKRAVVRSQSDSSPTPPDEPRPKTTEAEAEAEANNGSVESAIQDPAREAPAGGDGARASPGAKVAKELLKIGIRCDSLDGRLVAAFADGIKPDEIIEAGRGIVAAGTKANPSIGYVLSAVRGRRADAALAANPMRQTSGTHRESLAERAARKRAAADAADEAAQSAG